MAWEEVDVDNALFGEGKPIWFLFIFMPGHRYQELPNAQSSNARDGYRLPIVPMKSTEYRSPNEPTPKKVIIEKLCIRIPEFNP